MSLRFASTSLSMIRGLTWRDTIALIDADTLEPVSLVGVESATMRLREAIDATDVVFELSTANGRLSIANAAGGLIDIEVPAEDTLLLPANENQRTKYAYDLVLSRGGDPEVLEPATRGRVTVSPHVTRLLPEP